MLSKPSRPLLAGVTLCDPVLAAIADNAHGDDI
jgi:hypothetical protein